MNKPQLSVLPQPAELLNFSCYVDFWTYPEKVNGHVVVKGYAAEQIIGCAGFYNYSCEMPEDF